jgi:peroxiredoxin
MRNHSGCVYSVRNVGRERKSNMSRIKPTQKAPDLELPLVGGGRWSLGSATFRNFQLVIFYSGYHCSIAKIYLNELSRLSDQFLNLGTSVIAVSADNSEDAGKTEKEWGLENINIGFGLTEETMKSWGLFLSKKINPEEPEIFCEPAIFLIKNNGVIYFTALNSMSFALPSLNEVLSCVKYILEKSSPPRGGA